MVETERRGSDTLALKLPERWPLILGFAVLCAPTVVSLAEEQWTRETGAHEPIVLAAGGWLLWRQWPHLVREATPGNPLFTAVILGIGLPLYVFGRAYGYLTLEAGGVYFAGLALLQSRFGLKLFSTAWFPILYLGFAVPPPQSMLDAATAPLKQLVSYLATEIVGMFGLPVGRQGVTIFVGQYQLLVEDACSGLNSIIGLATTTFLYVYLVRGLASLRSLMLCVMILPVAVISNVVRVAVLVAVTYIWGDAVAQSYVHLTTGLALFALALGFMFGLDSLLGLAESKRTKP